MRGTFTLGRVLLGLAFLLFGINHALNGGDMTGIVPTFLPKPILWVYLVGALFIVGGLALLSHRHARMGASMIAFTVFCLIVLVHLPRVIADPSNLLSATQFLKDVAIFGGALTIAAHRSA